MVGASRLDSRLLRLFGPIVYVGSLLGLLAVFAVGSTVNGAHAWIRLGGGFEVQPSEFMKLGLIVGMAVLFTQRAAERDEDGPPTDVGRADRADADRGAARADHAAARPRFGDGARHGVVRRPDRGRRQGPLDGRPDRRGRAARRGRGARPACSPQYQIERVTSFTHPTHDTQGAAYNVTQAHIAIANGGLFGRGLFGGPQTNGGYVPEQQTDFVYSVAGEEFGLVGGLVIIGLFGLLCWRGCGSPRDADPAGRLLAAGVVCWFAFQAFQNIGMNLQLTPVTGLPLPFVSYGGSSMFAQGLAIGLLQAVNRRITS